MDNEEIPQGLLQEVVMVTEFLTAIGKWVESLGKTSGKRVAITIEIFESKTKLTIREERHSRGGRRRKRKRSSSDNGVAV